MPTAAAVAGDPGAASVGSHDLSDKGGLAGGDGKQPEAEPTGFGANQRRLLILLLWRRSDPIGRSLLLLQRSLKTGS